MQRMEMALDEERGAKNASKSVTRYASRGGGEREWRVMANRGKKRTSAAAVAARCFFSSTAV